ncbi:MAG: ATP-dependent zinc metalloprotease FtsH [Candidatus Sumerlaea chitinivorans]|nr:ATP-dependent zinc metalloprotease FtsH [Candidatus Sumerlaea chitinivorans]
MNGLRSASLWIIIFLVFILMFIQFSEKEPPKKLDATKVIELAKQKKLIEVVDKGGKLVGQYREAGDAKVNFTSQYLPGQESFILQVMTENNVRYVADPTSPFLSQFFFSLLLPFAVIMGLWYIIMRQIQGSGNKALSFGKSRAKLITEGQTKVTFEDVAGVDEAKEELKEIVEFLKDPQKFSRLGGKIPKGVLLVGPPGTGKTLLAKAVAGEANVPFFAISGSDFVEMFVGVGASRVRDLFEQAKKHKPCLVFIDEIDAVGRHRFAGIGGGHDEREQTLNQLLVEMDGFNSNEGIILIAATNRPDVLDPALLRPGRFDRQITVDYPDLVGREKILKVHARNVKLAKDVDLSKIAKATPGFSGADLANIINEAALLAARRNKQEITMAELEEAKDRVMLGPERRSLVLTENEKRLTAYHEAGHAVAGKLVQTDEEVHKVTIIPRGRALGITSFLPGEERFTQFKSKLKDRLVYMLGGRAAEEIIFGDFTTGAGNDLQRVTQIARRMVCEFGMSEVLGPRTFGEGHAPIFLGRDYGMMERDYSEATASLIDQEIKRIVDEAYARAKDLLTQHKDALIRVAEALIERETIDGTELEMLLRGEPLPPRTPPEDTPPAPAETQNEAAEAKARERRIFGQSILDRPSEAPS